MIRKNDEDLLNWIWELVTDFEDEFDDSYVLDVCSEEKGDN